ncbi:hypothetical protein G6F57_008911 [Rhizopus arrhizus]|uniref:Uncharacterized protein n=1 Tax=Rhizopus oryzae TaxID=64495 RepID=A0A9P6X4V2_RHIOR|nr:hypothetical protein G6F30_008433 [Rhizopus arrhizus]KAG1419682.1 hypothetical protein G6F58_004495 [Rhizopus delemar]KAG0978269.1 hypothetical protein G6F29_009443 [Rhizopus arrhizus]KAG0991511.1 hypothetical protein G6F28_008521 [Rhizopus arrhizus]KAG1005491.1 hypothetical protein G6F27_009174 [Rhizopus arrhizus]
MNEKGKGSKRNQEDTDGEEDTSEEGDMDEEEDTDEEEDEREMMTQRKKTSGKRVFPRPYLDRDLSNKHMEAHSIENHHVLESHHEFIDVFFDSSDLRESKSHNTYSSHCDYRASEDSFSESLMKPFLEVIAKSVKINEFKLNFDYRKGMFGALAMIKSIADEYEYAPIDQIEKIKILFLSAAGKTYLQYLHLWSLSYKKIELFDLWKKSSLLLRPEFDDKQYFVPDLIRFCWGSKNIIEKSVESIVSLKQGHSQNRAKYRRSSATKKMARE